MGRTACTEPQCLYKCELYLYLSPFIDIGGVVHKMLIKVTTRSNAYSLILGILWNPYFESIWAMDVCFLSVLNRLVQAEACSSPVLCARSLTDG
jgi:hypothetical protein